MNYTKEENSRDFFRVNLEVQLCSKLSIYKVDDKEVKSGETHACIRNIGPGGLCFISSLEFPVKENVTYNFNVTILKKQINFQGKIVRKKKIEENFWEYGVHFDVNERMRIKYIRLFNELAIHIIKRKSSLLHSYCSRKEGNYCIKPKAS